MRAKEDDEKMMYDDESEQRGGIKWERMRKTERKNRKGRFIKYGYRRKMGRWVVQIE